MNKLFKIVNILFFFCTTLYSVEYDKNYSESDFYQGTYDKIIRYDAISFASDENSSQKLQTIIRKIKKELEHPHIKAAVSLVGHSQQRESKEKAKEASSGFVESIYKVLLQNNIDKNIIYKYPVGDRVMLYSDETKSSSKLSNSVNINLYINYLRDDDNDGVYSDKDKCPNSDADEIVDENGCSAKNIVALVQGHKQETAIVVSNDAGSVLIENYNELTLINSSTIPPSKPKKIAQKKLKKAFHDVVSVDVVYQHYTFYFDDINLLDNSKKELNNMLLKIAKVKDPVIKIIGHTDTVGSNKYNYQLGLKRANEIKNIIMQAKIKALRIDAVSYGENNLAVKTADNVDEKRNRRVEVFIH